MGHEQNIPGPMKVEDVTDSVGHVGGARAGRDISVNIIGIACQHRLVVDRKVGYEDTRGGPGQAFHCNIKVSDCTFSNLIMYRSKRSQDDIEYIRGGIRT